MHKSLLLFFCYFILPLAHSQNEVNQFTDSRDGKIYSIVKIRGQTWMAENLAYKTSDGCWAYDDNQRNVAKYGYLYNWETANTVCPSGWRLPTKADYEILLNNYGGSSGYAVNYLALIPGGKSGFSALFGGQRRVTGGYLCIDKHANFWSSSEGDDLCAWNLTLLNSEYADMYDFTSRSCGYSVRCLRE